MHYMCRYIRHKGITNWNKLKKIKHKLHKKRKKENFIYDENYKNANKIGQEYPYIFC